MVSKWTSLTRISSTYNGFNDVIRCHYILDKQGSSPRKQLSSRILDMMGVIYARLWSERSSSAQPLIQSMHSHLNLCCGGCAYFSSYHYFVIPKRLHQLGCKSPASGINIIFNNGVEQQKAFGRKILTTVPTLN